LILFHKCHAHMISRTFFTGFLTPYLSGSIHVPSNQRVYGGVLSYMFSFSFGYAASFSVQTISVRNLGLLENNLHYSTLAIIAQITLQESYLDAVELNITEFFDLIKTGKNETGHHTDSCITFKLQIIGFGTTDGFVVREPQIGKDMKLMIV
ncbi:hypothetical protein ACJX0J_034402, partial [Zea mays]